MKRTCRKTGKVNYPSRNAAEKALARFNDNRRERMLKAGGSSLRQLTAAYKCWTCPYWHLTSSRRPFEVQ